MPYKSEKQRRAMKAAEKGKSKIGIPKSAAKEFSAEEKKAAFLERFKKKSSPPKRRKR